MMREKQVGSKKITYIEFRSQSSEVIFEQAFDLAPGCFLTWNLDPIFCTSSDID
jgi:hypothetical protein